MRVKLDDHGLKQTIYPLIQNGYYVIFESLPKMGTTSIAYSLGKLIAHHEYELDAIPQLLRMNRSTNYSKKINFYLQQRQEKLKGNVDICTSLYLITATMSEEEMSSKKIIRFTLNRSFYTWLKSIINWSEAWKGYKNEAAWMRALHLFVDNNNNQLCHLMPKELSDRRDCIKLWLPVWLTYQKLILDERRNKENIYYQEEFNLQERRNVSNIDSDLASFVESELKPVKHLKNSIPYNQKSLEQLKDFFIEWAEKL